MWYFVDCCYLSCKNKEKHFVLCGFQQKTKNLFVVLFVDMGLILLEFCVQMKYNDTK